MTHHRKAREMALQVLFQRGFSTEAKAEDLFASFADNFEIDNKTREYTIGLTQGVIENQQQIDSDITQMSENWSIDRMALIDKILLEIAIFELKYSTSTETAPKLCITDIIDLAKKYSSEESKNFINGILDKVYQSELS